VEAGASNFWVPRAYAHVIVNVRGMCGSEGTYTFFDSQERLDLHDVVEWGDRPGVVRRACRHDRDQLLRDNPAGRGGRAAPHLQAVFPLHLTTAMYDAMRHHATAARGS
jgi:hypothetical protein